MPTQAHRGEVAVITGASAGIGRATAREFAHAMPSSSNMRAGRLPLRGETICSSRCPVIMAPTADLKKPDAGWSLGPCAAAQCEGAMRQLRGVVGRG
jgi:hypothetical protein